MKQPKKLIRKNLNNNASKLAYRKLWKRVEDYYLCKCHGRAGERRINSIEMGHESTIFIFFFEQQLQNPFHYLYRRVENKVGQGGNSILANN